MIQFFHRPYPSANCVLLRGHRPVLVDTGFGADVPELLAWLETQQTPAASLSLILNTHSHCDHAGGNHELQRRFGTTIAASAVEAAPVNARDPDACRAWWLRQPIEAYAVAQSLEPDDAIVTGSSAWRLVATPGHTAGHISLHSAELGVLILGDALHAADLGWLNPYREGGDSLDRAEDTIDRLARLPAATGYSGHGPAIHDLPAAFARAKRRLLSWREAPERIAWHACKRIFSHGLMLEGGLAEPAVAPMLLDCPWFRDHAKLAFGVTPEAFVPMLVAEMLRADAAFWREGRLVARAPYAPVRPGWRHSSAQPVHWPRVQSGSPARL